MSSLHHVSRRDLEGLSAYLDGELRAQEARRLEIRLEEDRDLRAALTELRSVRDAVRSLPVLHPPRSLVLTPNMVGRSAGKRPYPLLQLATALATLAFLVVSGVNVVLSRGASMGASAPVEAPMMLQAPPLAAEATESAEVAGAPLLGEAPSSDALAPSATPGAAERAAPEISALGEGLAETPQAAAQPAPAEQAVEPSPLVTPAVGELEGAEKQAPAMPLRTVVWLQLGLGVLVIGLAMLTLRARRQAR